MQGLDNLLGVLAIDLSLGLFGKLLARDASDVNFVVFARERCIS